MIRKLIACAAFVLASALPSGAQVIEKLHNALPEEYRKNGINAAVFNDWAPDEFLDADGTLKGWSIDIAHEMEKRLGVKFTYTPTSFDAIIPGLMAKRFDAGFSSFGTTEERLKTLDFVSQRKIGSSFAYPKNSSLDIKTIEEACGLRVAVLNGSWDIPLLEKINKEECAKKPMVLQTFRDQAQADLAVRAGRVDATVTSSVKLAYQASRGSDIKVSELLLNPVDSCIGIRKGDPLGQVMTDAIQSMIDDGTYRTIMEKWGIADKGMLTKARLITKEKPDL